MRAYNVECPSMGSNEFPITTRAPGAQPNHSFSSRSKKMIRPFSGSVESLLAAGASASSVSEAVFRSGSEADLQEQLTQQEFQERMLALQQLYQREYANLVMNYQQAQVQLATQHFRYSQQLMQEYVEKRHEAEAAASLANQLQAEAEMAELPERTASYTDVNCPQLTRSSSHGSNVSSTSGRVSNQTKERLKAMIYNKQRLQKKLSDGSMKNAPNGVSSGSAFRLPHSNPDDDYELRKASSEPNLKMKSVLALRQKLLNRPSPLQHPGPRISPPKRHHILPSDNVIPPPPTSDYRSTLSSGFLNFNQAGISQLNSPYLLVGTNSMDAAQLVPPTATTYSPVDLVHCAPLGFNAYGGSPQLFSSLSVPTLMPSGLPLVRPPVMSPFISAAAVASMQNSLDDMREADQTDIPLLANDAEHSPGDGDSSRNVLVRPLDRRTFSSPLPLGQALTGAGYDPNPPDSSSPVKSNELKEQLRNIVLRRKSLVREETEEEVRGETQPLFGGSSGSRPAYPGKSFSFPLPVSEASSCSSSFDDAYGDGPSQAGCSGLYESESRPISDNGQPLTGLGFDTLMCKHQCACRDSKRHLEHSGRIQSIWARLQETGLVGKCEKLLARKAPLEYVRLVHKENYVNFFGSLTAQNRTKLDLSDLPVKSFTRLPCGGVGVDLDTYFSDHFTASAARVAVGCVTELSLGVAEGRLKNAFAIVRPPGHHAEPDQALGFCYFNNVAIAARVVQQKMDFRRICVVDWDVHHGNGTQMAFEYDPGVLYISLHRHDNGNFFPGTGAIREVGMGTGEGFTVNIAFSDAAMGDPEYLAAWRSVVMPVIAAYNPALILVSAGFDATKGHPNNLGGYGLTSATFGYFTSQLMAFAQGKVVLALEGGYDLASICDCSEECVRVLCGERPSAISEESLSEKPNQSACEALRHVIEVHRRYWFSLREETIDISQNDYEALASRFASLTVKQRKPTGSNEDQETDRMDVDVGSGQP